MLEHVIHANVMRYLEQSRILSDEQRCLCRCSSIETHLVLSVNDVANILHRQIQADVVIMDFTKAFDLEAHQRFILKFHHFGITGKLHNWIQKILTMRTQQIVLEGVSSSSITVTSGVPQGTVFGPLLFILYLNGLPEGISSQVCLLTDDCILCHKINTLNDCHEHQRDINSL